MQTHLALRGGLRRASTTLCVACALAALSPATTNDTAQAAPELLTADERAWLTAQGPLSYSTYPAAPPLGFVRPDDQLDGIARDLMELLAKKLRAEVKPITYDTWTETLAGIRDGEFDVLVGVPRTPARETYLLFSRPYQSVPMALFIDRERPPIKGIKDLGGRHVGVMRNTAEHHWMQRVHPEITLEEVETAREGLLLVAVGQLGAMVTGLPIGHCVIAENALDNLGVAPEALFVAPHHLAVQKGQDRLLHILQIGLDHVSPQEIQAITEKWINVEHLAPSRGPSPWVWRGALILLAVLAAAIAWNYSLRRRVAIQAQQIRAQVEQEAHLERRCSELIENATDMVFTRDLEGNYTSINPAGERLLGYPRDELLRMNVSQVVISEHMERLRQQTAKLVAQGHSIYEMQVRTKDGRLLWLEASLRMLRKDGRPIGVQGIARDVTERHEAEQQLRDSELLYHSLVEQLPQAIFRLDRDGRITFANFRYCQMLGRTLNDVLGKTDSDLFPPDVAKTHRSDDLRVMETGAALETLERHIGHDGQELFAHVLKFPLRGAGGQIAGIQCLLWDMTERMHVEDALRSSRQLLALHVEQTPLGVIEWDLYFQVTAWNAAAEKIFGYTATEALGRHAAELIVPPDVRPRIDQIWDSLLAQIGGTRSTNKNVTKDGRVIFCEWYNTPLVDASGTVVAVASLVQDVTEQHEAEEARARLEAQLRQAQKMEAVGQLAGGVAHEFNNILTVILGNANLLQEDAGPSPSAQAEIRELIKAAEQAATLTRQMLTFSRQNVMHMQPADLNDVLSNITQMLGRLIGEDISLKCSHAPVKLHVEADAALIGQVIVNLAVNAREAMPSGGSLTITTGLETVSPEQVLKNPEARPGEFATLAIADTGCGMDEATRAHLFEPFFTTKEVGKGSGLGLAMTYGIIKQHNGWIETNSQIHRGSIFKIFLPFCPAANGKATAPQIPVGPHPERGPETILVVEDEEAVRRFLQTFLEKQGYQILAAANGDEALREWKSAAGKIDLLLTDIVMPGGMSGHDLADKLRIANPGLKVILSSGYSRDATDAAHEILPDQIYLPKPYSPSTLAQAVRRCLDLHPCA